MDFKETIKLFKDAGFEGRVFDNMEDAYRWIDSQKPVSIPCRYNGELRYVVPDTCEYHVQAGDPVCQRCQLGIPVSNEIMNLALGEYKPNGKGGWKLKKKYNYSKR